MIYNYGPELRYELSRSPFSIYELEKENEIDEEERRMDLFNSHFSYATPSKRIINKLKKYIGIEKVLEINSYSGLWSYLLFEEEIDIKATDHNKYDKIPFINIENINPMNAIEKYNNRNILLTVWPHFKKNYYKLNNIVQNFHGDSFILITEKNIASKIINNITHGTNQILKELKDKKIEYEWILVKEFHIPKWLDLDYKVYLLEKQDL